MKLIGKSQKESIDGLNISEYKRPKYMCVAKMCGISKTNQNSNENK